MAYLYVATAASFASHAVTFMILLLQGRQPAVLGHCEAELEAAAGDRQAVHQCLPGPH